MPQQMIDVLIEDARWREQIDDPLALIEQWRQAAAAFEPRLNATAAILLTDAVAVTRLNADFRGKNQPTNVLSFPAEHSTATEHLALSEPEAPAFLGDVALSFETCLNEAQKSAIPFENHTAHLVVHGLLHLIGYDHQNDDDALIMERLETEILASLGIANPYRANPYGADPSGTNPDERQPEARPRS